MFQSFFITIFFYYICYVVSWFFEIENKHKFINTSNTILFGSYYVYLSLNTLPEFETIEDTVYKTTDTSINICELLIIRNLVDLYFIYNDDNNKELYIHHGVIITSASLYYYNNIVHYYICFVSLIELSSFFASLTFTIKYYTNYKYPLIVSGICLWFSHLFRMVVLVYTIIIFNYDVYYNLNNFLYNNTLSYLNLNIQIIPILYMSSIWFVKITNGLKKLL